MKAEALADVKVHVAVSICVVVLMLCTAVYGEPEDVSPPQLVAFGFGPTMIDVATSSQDVSFTLTVTDNLSGLYGADLFLMSPSGVQHHTLHIGQWNRTSGDPQSGTYQRSLTIPQFSEAGTWYVRRLFLNDAVGNWINLYTEDLVAKGFATQLSVTGGPDLAVPVLAGFDFSPVSIDVGSSSEDVSFTLTVTDEVAGLYGADLFLMSPSGVQHHTLHIGQWNRTSGDPQSGTYQRSLTIPQFSEAGTWYVRRLFLNDAVGNWINLYTEDLFGLGFPTELEVTSMPDDTDPPDLVGFDFSPVSIDVGSSSEYVSFTVTVTDNLSGLYGADLFLMSPSGVQHHTLHIGQWNRTSGDPQSGTYQRSLTIPQFSEAGTWYVRRLFLNDAVGNWINLYTEDLFGLGFPVYLEIGQNQDPVAIAGADRTGIVGETLIFDGSGSNDPDGTIVIFEWDFGDNSPHKQGEWVTHTYFEAGSYIVTLTITDDGGAFSTGQLHTLVLTQSEAADTIISTVESLDLPGGLESSLISKLDNVVTSLNGGRPGTAINQLNAFLNQAHAQRGKKISEDDADKLTADALRLIDAIQGSVADD